ncbi:TonB-dependent receptor [Altererythrobacter aurantiacus]|uniref:TonB-dependent receptor n=1 Tax=Parapontixanthobacter aurantiacus TaxID=1463599 RepID=A0A844ZG13_9SPHN|nr:TonB-dependent receptor [Parapontixanthobacter aurantiacus]MXO85920.1 TonB-dependent receptor [Parapontixanthobacter aurantiacus]
MFDARHYAGLLLLSSSLALPSAASAQSIGIPPGDDPSTEEAEEIQAEEAQGVVEPGEDVAAEELVEPDVSIPGSTIIVTGRRRQDPVRSSSQVLSVLSAEDIARTGEGDIAGALGRVTGLSLVGDGRVFVRGLGDRYSLALLNGLPLPSPEPLSRVVPLDIFPTNVVASSLVQKSYSANFPGEFGGGVINLTTRAVPDESFVTISGSIGGDTETTFGNGLDYYGSDYDWFGFDNGNRDIPGNLAAFIASGERIEDTPVEVQEGIASQLFPTNLVTVQRIGELPVNFSASLTGGTSVEVGDGAYLGIIATASLKNEWRNRNVRSQEANTDLSELSSDFTTFITDNNVLFNALLGFGLEVDEHRFRWTNLYIRDTLKTARLGRGTRFQLGETGFDFINQNTAWFERQLIDSQGVAELEFGDLSIDLRGGYARTDREAPFNATFSYTRTNLDDQLGNEYVVYLNRQSDTGLVSVSFDDLQEELWYAGIDVSYRFLDSITATVGYAYSDTDRFSVRREFSPRAQGDFLDDSLVPYIGLRRPGSIINGASLAAFDIRLDETSPFPAFDAALTINAGYGLVRFTPLDPFTVELGVRYEDAEQTVALDQTIFNNPITGAIPTNNFNDYWLPGVTLTLEATDALQFRASASRTIARPQFRELVEQLYFDPESNRAYRGNPFLTDSELTNAELRAEYYLSNTDRLSVAGFYKRIENPIEAFVTTAAGNLLTSYANAPEAELYGAEFEATYGYDLFDLGGWFETKQLRLGVNYTFTQSSISVAEDDITRIPPTGDVPATLYFSDGDRLVGQSDHVANVQFGLEDLDKLQQFTFLVNYASERVTSRGFQRPDIIEDPGLTLDFVARAEVNLASQPFEVELEARNITGRDNLEFQENGDARIDVNSYEVGRRFSVSLSTEF